VTACRPPCIIICYTIDISSCSEEKAAGQPGRHASAPFHDFGCTEGRLEKFHIVNGKRSYQVA
jgi:hypothetical protein